MIKTEPGDEVDARGLLCPLPVLRLRKRLMSVAPGTRLRLIATDPAAVVDVPHFCAEGGHVMVEMRELEDGARAFTVERGPGRRAD
ncbi:sulfurtransferase TusA family protein [uncultured Paracoccus sp.]|uniref:sulfurtransferase TusA family protein n=1 Tax=uncultured Paracoccus sp. TaxID=189685 RepID=UPI0026124789|nr:sulfurtransferase TusA family protein [uncultured Paracoccus sp.]